MDTLTVPIQVGLMVDFHKESLENYGSMLPTHEANLRLEYEKAIFSDKRTQVLNLSTLAEFTEIESSDIPGHPGIDAVHAKAIAFRTAYNSQETGLTLSDVPDKVTCVQYEYINDKWCVRYNYKMKVLACTGESCPPPGAEIRIYVKVCEDEA